MRDTRSDSFRRLEEFLIRAAMLVLIATGLFKIIAPEVSSLGVSFNLPAIWQFLGQLLPTLLIGVISICALVVIVYLFVFLLRSRSAKTVTMKQEVAKAFMHALEQSSFNPHRHEKDAHEQLSK